MMSLQHKTDAELIETAAKLAGYSEAGPVLKELMSRWQALRELNDLNHQQMVALAAESESIRQYAINQTNKTADVISLLDTVPLNAEQQAIATARVEQLTPLFTLNNAINQLRAVEVVDLQTALTQKFSESARIKQMDALDLMAMSCCIDSVTSRRLAELLYLPVGPVPVVRDDTGLWSHPASALQPDWDESTPAYEIKEWFNTYGLETKIVSLEDQNDELFEQCLEDFSAASQWEPTSPEGDDWFLFSIFDTEDGIHAEFARPESS